MNLATSVARKAGNYIACDAVNLLSGVSKRQITTTYARDTNKDVYNPTSVPANFSKIPFYIFAIPEEKNDILTFQKQVIKVMLDMVESDTTTALILYTAYWSTIDTKMELALYEPLKNAGYELIFDIEFPTWKESNRYIKDIDIDNITELEFVDLSHIRFHWGIISNFLGKSLNTNNFDAWYSNRRNSYAIPSGLIPSNPDLEILKASITFCQSVYAALSYSYEYRRVFFYSLKNISESRKHYCSSPALVTMNLLKGAEISNFLFINRWILELNPWLLGWAELAKFVPDIKRANDKYISLGELAPYCKLLFPPQQLTEFNRDHLRIPFSVAIAISRNYNQSSVQFLVGDSNDTAVQKIVEDALNLVKIAGGARTRITQAVREYVIDSFENKDLISGLDKGALMTDERVERDPSQDV